VNLSDKKVVVVGAGTIAKRRIRALVDFTDHLFVVAPEVNPELHTLEAAGRLTILRKKYDKEDIHDAAMVIAATNDHRLNQEIYVDCKEMNVPVNVCDDKTRCDFYFPVLAYSDPIVVGVNSAGRDAAGSKRVAAQIREMLQKAVESTQSVFCTEMGKIAQSASGAESEKNAQSASGMESEKKPKSASGMRAEEAMRPALATDSAKPAKTANKTIRIFTDGAARGNPDGPGGYGVVLQYTDAAGTMHEKELSQGYVKTTNNRMELMAAIVGLEALNRPCEVELYSDSQYLINAFNQHWLDGWIKRNWMRNKTDPVKNVDLWKRLLAAAGPHQITWHWVKGHDGHPENERCDRLATSAADGEDLQEDVVPGFP